MIGGSTNPISALLVTIKDIRNANVPLNNNLLPPLEFKTGWKISFPPPENIKDKGVARGRGWVGPGVHVPEPVGPSYMELA